MRYFWQGNHRIYGHIRCIYTVLANPTYVLKFCTTNVATPHCTSSTSSAGRPAAGTLLKSLLTCVFLHNEPHHSTSPTKSAGKPAARTLLKSLLTCVFLHNEPHHSTSPTKSGGKPAAGTLLKSLLTCVLCTTSHTTQPHQLNLQASQRQGRCSNAYLRVCFLHTESHNSTASTSCAGRPAARTLLKSLLVYSPHYESHHSTSPTSSAGRPAARTLLKTLFTCLFLAHRVTQLHLINVMCRQASGKDAAVAQLLKSLTTRAMSEAKYFSTGTVLVF